MPAAAAFDVHAVSKTFGTRAALDAVSLTIAPGEMVALIGPSGSGKSTLLRTLNGLIPIDGGEGRVEAFGQSVQAGGRVSDHVRQVRARIGFVFQQFNLVGRLSLYANVALGTLARLPPWRGLLGLWPKAEAMEVMSALVRVGVAEYAGQKASTLSGGQQQRGAIARVLAQKAQAVLADEPVASLDPVSARKVMALLSDLNRIDGLTVVVSLHQVEYALRYCSRVVALKAGKLVYDGPSLGLDRERLVEIYGPEIQDVLWEGEQR
ncbi:MAG TPA: phosphonate ABC transporter ATP-binding protein [Caulobacteraceae bacterium]|nr:phosphonate ABC transporter ATP-binding protein [Caulobacteraceae bacterium]